MSLAPLLSPLPFLFSHSLDSRCRSIIVPFFLPVVPNSVIIMYTNVLFQIPKFLFMYISKFQELLYLEMLLVPFFLQEHLFKSRQRFILLKMSVIFKIRSNYSNITIFLLQFALIYHFSWNKMMVGPSGHGYLPSLYSQPCENILDARHFLTALAKTYMVGDITSEPEAAKPF